jgi:hypothetical protein
MKALLCLLLFASAASAQLVRLPEPPELTPSGETLILDFETGRRAAV